MISCNLPSTNKGAHAVCIFPRSARSPTSQAALSLRTLAITTVVALPSREVVTLRLSWASSVGIDTLHPSEYACQKTGAVKATVKHIRCLKAYRNFSPAALGTQTCRRLLSVLMHTDRENDRRLH